MVELRRTNGELIGTGETILEIVLANKHNLYGADLYGADLRGADLRDADLKGADLYGADLRWAELRYADLKGADLRGVDLRYADLYGAYLRGADLRYADLYGAYPGGTEHDEGQLGFLSILPEGEIVGYKLLARSKIARLIIPRDAKRSNGTGRKCRAEYAIVGSITSIDGETQFRTGYSFYDPTLLYEVGEMVRPTRPFNKDRWSECASGIHFFITRQEAIDYGK